MEQPAREIKGWKKGGRLVVMAGERKIQEMIVRLMYKKLKTLLKERSLKE